jgi:hypothetical protein
MQLSVAARVRALAISPAAILSPYVSLARFRLVPHAPAKFSSSHAPLLLRLSSIGTCRQRVLCAVKLRFGAGGGWSEFLGVPSQ